MNSETMLWHSVSVFCYRCLISRLIRQQENGMAHKYDMETRSKQLRMKNNIHHSFTTPPNSFAFHSIGSSFNLLQNTSAFRLEMAFAGDLLHRLWMSVVSFPHCCYLTLCLRVARALTPEPEQPLTLTSIPANVCAE